MVKSVFSELTKPIASTAAFSFAVATVPSYFVCTVGRIFGGIPANAWPNMGEMKCTATLSLPLATAATAITALGIIAFRCCYQRPNAA